MNATTDGNPSLYGQGRRYSEKVARHVARGVEPRAALRRVACDLGQDFGKVRSAVDFRTAVDLIAGNAGLEARELILGGHRCLPPERVMQLARTHPDRQRYEIAQVGRGRPLFARPPAGVDPPFDTLGLYEVRSRLARGAGLIERAAGAFAATPGGSVSPPKRW